MSTENFLSDLGPLAPLYKDPAVVEIMVDSPERVSIKCNGKLANTDIRFDSPEALLALIANILKHTGGGFAANETVKDVRFPDNRARALIVLPPTAIHGPYLVIRKTPYGEITWDMLLQYGVISQDVYHLLQSAIQARANILVAGGTASGKTTILNRLAELIPPEERVIIAEEAHEFQIDHPRAVYIEANPTSTPMKELLYAAIKMRPDRLVISELTSSEAFYVCEIFNAGYTGGMTAIHALGCEDALIRLESLCLMANPGLGLNEIRASIASAFQLIVYQKLLTNGRRRITEAVELCGLENGHYLLQKLIHYDPEKDVMALTNQKPTWS